MVACRWGSSKQVFTHSFFIQRWEWDCLSKEATCIKSSTECLNNTLSSTLSLSCSEWGVRPFRIPKPSRLIKPPSSLTLLKPFLFFSAITCVNRRFNYTFPWCCGAVRSTEWEIMNVIQDLQSGHFLDHSLYSLNNMEKNCMLGKWSETKKRKKRVCVYTGKRDNLTEGAYNGIVLGW